MTSLIRPEISGLSEYHLAQYPHSIKLNQTENPYELPLPIQQEILDRLAAARWSRYPAFVPAEQIDMLATFAGWVPEGTLLGNGSNDLLQLIFTAVLERGRTVVLSQPTFTLYTLLARGLGADVREVLMRPDLSFDVDGIIQAARTSKASLIVLCSPNNPTGTLMAEQDVVRIIEQTESLVVLDEAYVLCAWIAATSPHKLGSRGCLADLFEGNGCGRTEVWLCTHARGPGARVEQDQAAVQRKYFYPDCGGGPYAPMADTQAVDYASCE